MDFNIGGGSYFNAGDFAQHNQNQAGIMDTKSRAIMYVFRPYANQFGDVGMRPFLYNFDENFLGAAQEVNDLAKRGVADSSSIVDHLASHNLNDYLTPSAQPAMSFKASLLSDRWRFILLLTETGRDLRLGNTVVNTDAANQLRRIYTGYFENGEPFNPGTFSSTKRTLNPNAFMVITHKTVLESSMEQTQFGPHVRFNTKASEEVHHSQITNAFMGHNTGHGLHLMTPSHCVNAMEDNGEGYTIAMPGAHGDLTSDAGCHVTPDLLEQPRHNVAQIVRGMTRHQDEMTKRNNLSSYQVNSWVDDSFVDQSFVMSSLARNLSLPRMKMQSVFDLEPDDQISAYQLDQMVEGRLELVPFSLERPQFYETADQFQTSYTNQYSLLIASVIAPILNSAGLNAMTFEFQVAYRNGMIEPQFQTHACEPSWPMPHETMLRKAKAVEVELTGGILKTIFDAMGEFYVAVDANATGMTTVRLALVEQGYRNPVDFQIPSMLGGLISPILGNDIAYTHNSHSITDLYSHAAGTATSHFNSNDHDFMAHAMTRDWREQMTIDPTDERMQHTGVHDTSSYADRPDIEME